VRRAEDHVNKVLYFDMRKHGEGLAPVAVDRHNALYDLLMFPLVHEKGVGGYFYDRDGSSVQSSTGVKLSLQMYARAMLFQNPRLHYLGRLAQEIALVQHRDSRHVEDTLNFQRFGKVQAKLKCCRDVKPGMLSVCSFRSCPYSSQAGKRRGEKQITLLSTTLCLSQGPFGHQAHHWQRGLGHKKNIGVYICSA
jgi:hypothetical protein